MYSIELDDVFLPGAWMEFPIVAEELPIWYSIGPLAWLTAHELGHALLDSLEEVHRKGLPEGRNLTVLESYYYVRYFSRIILKNTKSPGDRFPPNR